MTVRNKAKQELEEEFRGSRLQELQGFIIGQKSRVSSVPLVRYVFADLKTSLIILAIYSKISCGLQEDILSELAPVRICWLCVKYVLMILIYMPSAGKAPMCLDC